MKTKVYTIGFFTILLTWLAGMQVYAQQAESLGSSHDSLTLAVVLDSVMKTHPSIKQAEEAINNATSRINLAKSNYLPDVDVSAGYTRLGPVTKFDFPSFGTIQLMPENNYSAALNYRQTLYDFGKTSNNVKVEGENKLISEKNVDLVKQKLTLLTANTFYSLVFMQEAILIKNKQLKTLNEHLAFITKRNSTGSATSYELLATKVKISATESQKTDLESMKKAQLSVLNSLMGTTSNSIQLVKKDLNPGLSLVLTDSLLNYAFDHRVEMQLAKERENLAQMQYSLVKSQNNPVLSAFASGGAKNGYMPNINKIIGNYSAGVTLRIPIFDANREKNNLAMVKTSMITTGFDTELAKRNISNEVIENEANRLAALQKIKQFELQLEQAEQAFEMANTSYASGTITNLDLLDAETTVSESRLQLLKTKIDYIISTYKLKIAIGDKI